MIKKIWKSKYIRKIKENKDGKKMLIRVSLVEKKAELFVLELIALDVMNIKKSSLLQALKSLEQIAQKNNSIQSIKFESVSLYVNPIKNYFLRIVSEDPLNDLIIEKISTKFDEIPLENIKKGELDDELETYLDSLFEEEEIEEEQIEDDIDTVDLKEESKPTLTVKSIEPVKKKKIPFKIAVCGIGKAGKTSINRKFFKKWTAKNIMSIKPTLGLERTQNSIDFLEENAAIFDFGGQRSFRGNYFKKQFLWKGIKSFIYVVDIQDPSKFVESKEYLDKILEVVKEQNDPLPKFSLMIHKYDQEKIEENKPNLEKLFEVFEDYKPFANIFLTNIFDDSSNIAIIKTLFLSMPGAVLKKILENKFLGMYESDLIPKIRNLIDQREVLNLSSEKLKIAIYRVTALSGRNCGHAVEKDWLKYMQGEWNDNSTKSDQEKIVVTDEIKYIDIKILNLKYDGLSSEIIRFTVNMMMRGITKVLDIENLKQIKSDESIIQWHLVF
jgi:signal recognition particle receptor subunit beta